MNKIGRKLICILLSLILAETNTILAQDNLSANVAHVYATYGEGDKVDVLYEMMEVDASTMTDLSFEIEMSNGEKCSYSLVQYEASSNKRYEIASSSSDTFKIDASLLHTGIPLYLRIFDSHGRNVLNRLLTIRVNKGLVDDLVPEEFSSGFQSDVKIDMEELLPGMNFTMHPYLIPVTVKSYTDGRFVIGLGLNSSNTSFWKDAYEGNIGPGASMSDLEKAFWGNSKKRVP